MLSYKWTVSEILVSTGKLEQKTSISAKDSGKTFESVRNYDINACESMFETSFRLIFAFSLSDVALKILTERTGSCKRLIGLHLGPLPELSA